MVDNYALWKTIIVLIAELYVVHNDLSEKIKSGRTKTEICFHVETIPSQMNRI